MKYYIGFANISTREVLLSSVQEISSPSDVPIVSQRVSVHELVDSDKSSAILFDGVVEEIGITYLFNRLNDSHADNHIVYTVFVNLR